MRVLVVDDEPRLADARLVVVTRGAVAADGETVTDPAALAAFARETADLHTRTDVQDQSS